MTKEDFLSEITMILEYIEETRNSISHEYDKFQIVLTNTLRLLDDSSSTLTRLKGSTEDLKGYLVKTSSEIKQTTLEPFDQLKTRIERVLSLVQNT
ncbi:MAG: hypothetical protein ACFFEE_02005 [Candidatus Thorarchaeota archaeon]